MLDRGFFQKLSKEVETIGWNKQYVGQMIVQNWPSRWFKWFKNVSRVCASWRERACPDRTSAQSSLGPHSSARSCWSPAKNDFATLKLELKKKNYSVSAVFTWYFSSSRKRGLPRLSPWNCFCSGKNLTQITIFCTHLLKKTVNNGMIFPQYTCI